MQTMIRKINRVKLFVKDHPISNKVANYLRSSLEDNQYTIVEDNSDLIISIGGDGTFLGMISQNNFSNETMYIGINCGNLGFLQDVNLNEIDDFIKCLNKNEYSIEELSYASVEIENDNNKDKYLGLNEIVVRNNNSKTLFMPIFIDNTFLENFCGDGILVSTPTGSTAYNLSIGGPLIHNKLDVLTLTPIAPINNSVYNTLRNSFIIPNESEIVLKNPDKSALTIVIDGKEKRILVNEIKISTDNKKIKCMRMKNYNYIQLIDKKILNNYKSN